jgi:hypothetical protein
MTDLGKMERPEKIESLEKIEKLEDKLKESSDYLIERIKDQKSEVP